MPVHDWSRVDANLFHDFHQTWSVNIRNALNAGLLPPGYSALVEQHAGGLIPDVVAPERRAHLRPDEMGGGVRAAPSQTGLVVQAKSVLAQRGNRIAIRHRLGKVVSVIEIVSPGNKASRAGLRTFVDKTLDFLRQDIHTLVVDLLPPTSRDPEGIHKAISDEIEEQPFELPAHQRLTLAAYVAGDPFAGIVPTAYVGTIGVGDSLPDMPAYLSRDGHVPVPLENTYQATWASCPPDFRALVETGRLPGEEE
jgi:hypothetical protein